MDKEFIDYPELQLQEYEFTRPESGKDRFPAFTGITEPAKSVQYFSTMASNKSMQ
jgi:hypothetical protein